MKALLTILFFLSTHFSFAGDELPTPEIIVTPMSQNETPTISSQQSEQITLDIQDIVSHDEIAKIDKKSRYLKLLEKLRKKSPEKVRSILTKLKVSPEFQDFILEDLIKQLDQAPDAILTANASGFGVRPTIFGGFGFSDYLIEKMGESKWTQNIPNTPKLGIAFAGGVSTLFFDKEGRKHMVIRFSAQYETPIKIINWMCEAFACVVPMKVSDKIDLNSKAVSLDVLKYDKSYLGLAGTIVAQNGYFEHAYPIGATVGVGAISFYKLSVHELRLNILFSIQGLVNLKNAAVKTCRSVLRIKPSTSE